MRRRKTLISISVGMFMIAASLIFSHYMILSDLTKGLLMGVGIGLLLIATIFGNLKAVK